MTEYYIETEGESDTRHLNFECDNPDKNLGCDPGIDVALPFCPLIQAA